MILLDDFFVRAILAAVFVAVCAAPLGCFVIWRRMAYFGDATAHAAILGVALGLALNLPPLIGVLAVSVGAALLVTELSNRGQSSDALLGVIAYGGLGIGLVAVSLLPGRTPDLMGFLFGDILAVSQADVGLIFLGVVVVLGVLLWRWNALVTATFTPDLAAANGDNPKRETIFLALVLALTIALSIKVVGVLLIGALLIIPAATARPFANTPERMAIFAAGFGLAAAVLGPIFAFEYDTPAGPTIVCLAVALFAFGQAIVAAKSAFEK